MADPRTWLRIRGRWALALAMGARPFLREAILIDALLALTDAAGAAALRRQVRGMPPVEGDVLSGIELRGGPFDRWEACLSRHIELHPLIVTRRVGPGCVAALLVPRCSDPSGELSCNTVVVMGRSREQVLHNAWRRLVARGSLPLHPSWEGPVMAHLERVNPMGDDPPIRPLNDEGPLRFALLDMASAQREVEELWRVGRLPDPE